MAALTSCAGAACLPQFSLLAASLYNATPFLLPPDIAI
jgi:hypothetical protein